MSNPIKHHFVPQFYLKNWQNDDGKIYCLRKNKGKPHPVYPKSVSFKNNLYKFASEIETVFITPFIDDRFSHVVNKARQNPLESLTRNEKFELIIFIILMHLRNPIEVKKIQSYQKDFELNILNDWGETIGEAEFNEFKQGYEEGMIIMVGLAMREIKFTKEDLNRIKRNKNLFEQIYNFSLLSQESWSNEIFDKYKSKKILFCEYNFERPELLTSSSPVYFGKPNELLTIIFNITPKKGYIITENKNLIREFNNYSNEEKICFLNQYHINHKNAMEIYMHESQKEKF